MKRLVSSEVNQVSGGARYDFDFAPLLTASAAVILTSCILNISLLAYFMHQRHKAQVAVLSMELL